MRNQSERSGFLTVDYDDSDGASYKGLELHIGEKIHRFDTGNPVVDFYDYLLKLGDINVEYVNCSSSVEHYLSDGAVCEGKEVVELYLHADTLKPVKKLDIATLMSHGYFRIWGLKGMKTIDDVKSYVQEKKGIKK